MLCSHSEAVSQPRQQSGNGRLHPQRWTGVGLRAQEGHDVLGQARLLALKGASGEKAGGDLLGQARRTVVRKNALLGFLFIV